MESLTKLEELLLEDNSEGGFDLRCVADTYDKLSGHNYALRAFAALLRSSGLDDFADQGLSDTLKSDNFEAANLRWGLSQSIDLYLAHQESILSGYVDQYQRIAYAPRQHITTIPVQYRHKVHKPLPKPYVRYICRPYLIRVRNCSVSEKVRIYVINQKKEFTICSHFRTMIRML